MSQKKPKNKSEAFAVLLHNSLVPQELKDEILKELPKMDESEILALFAILQTEHNIHERVLMQLEIELDKIRNK